MVATSEDLVRIDIEKEVWLESKQMKVQSVMFGFLMTAFVWLKANRMEQMKETAESIVPLRKDKSKIMNLH